MFIRTMNTIGQMVSLTVGITIIVVVVVLVQAARPATNHPLLPVHFHIVVVPISLLKTYIEYLIVLEKMVRDTASKAADE